MGEKYGLNKHEIETLKEAIDILDDIGCDEYADNIRGVLEDEMIERSIDNAHNRWQQCLKEANGNIKKARELYDGE